MKLHTLALITAMAVSGASLSMAQTAQPGAMPPPTPGAGPAPISPSAMSPGDPAAPMAQPKMKHGKKPHDKSKSKPKPATGADKENGSGTGFARPDSKP